MRNGFHLMFAVGACLLVAACGDDDVARPAECEAIVERCHPLDTGMGQIHECHESAETTWTAAECTSNTAMCFAVCPEPIDGGDSDAGGDAG